MAKRATDADPDYTPKKRSNPAAKSSNPSAEDYAALVCPKCGVEKNAFRCAYIAQWTAMGFSEYKLHPHASWARHVQGARLGKPCDPNVLGKAPAPKPEPVPKPEPKPPKIASWSWSSPASPVPVPVPAPVEAAPAPKPKPPLRQLLDEAKGLFDTVDKDVKVAEGQAAKLHKEGDEVDREIARLKRKRQRITETAEELDARIKRARAATDRVQSGLEAVRTGVRAILGLEDLNEAPEAAPVVGG